MSEGKAEILSIKVASLLYKKLLILVLMVGSILAAYRFQQYSKLLIDPRRSVSTFFIIFFDKYPGCFCGGIYYGLYYNLL
jgi:hypothetical protein